MSWEGLNPPYATIVADPPWPFDYNGGGSWFPGRINGMGYSTMDLEVITGLPVGQLAGADGWLFMWCTRGIFREGVGVHVMRSWGYEPTGELIWEKYHMGTGGFPRPCHEPLLIGRRGHPATPKAKDVRSVRKMRSRSRHHSAKPPAAYDLIEQHYPGPYLELFARAQRLGWDSWGKGYEIGVA